MYVHMYTYFCNKINLLTRQEEAKNLLTAVKDITTYFKHNTNVADSLKKAQDHQAKPLGLIQSVCTRWNSIFYHLERFVQLSEIIAPILLKNLNGAKINNNCKRT